MTKSTPQQRAAAAALLDKANAALAANATFLAIGSPTNAQILAQTRLLTRQVNALIRLVRGMYGHHVALADAADT